MNSEQQSQPQAQPRPALRGVAGDAYLPPGADPVRSNAYSLYMGGTKPLGWSDPGANFSIVNNWQQANRSPVAQGRPILGTSMAPVYGGGSMGAGGNVLFDGGAGASPFYRPIGSTSSVRSRRPAARRPQLNQVVTPPKYQQLLDQTAYAYA